MNRIASFLQAPPMAYLRSLLRVSAQPFVWIGSIAVTLKTNFDQFLDRLVDRKVVPVETGERLHTPRDALKGTKSFFLTIGIFSVLVNLVQLIPSLYMLEIYDRVIPSHSRETLVSLTLLLTVFLMFSGVLDYVRTRVSSRLGAQFQQRLNQPVLDSLCQQALQSSDRSKAVSALRDVDAVQKLMSSPVLFAGFDMPWVLVFAGVLYMIHPYYGIFAACTIVYIVGITMLYQFRTRKLEADAMQAANASEMSAYEIYAGIDDIVSNGMSDAVDGRWTNKRNLSIELQQKHSDVSSKFTTFSKTTRMWVQSCMLGLGAFLVVRGEMSGGLMIAGSILLGRALAPIDQLLQGWPLIQRARQGWRSLEMLLAESSSAVQLMDLENPEGVIAIESGTILVPPSLAQEEKNATLCVQQGIHFPVGKVTALMGPNGSGKTTLLRLLSGVWKPLQGGAWLDGHAYRNLQPATLGRHFGVVYQTGTLFQGTVLENIARMEKDPDNEAVIEAARLAGTHEMIMRLSQGYHTVLRGGNQGLSSGQMLGIALARAFFGKPKALLLDEPNANLDQTSQEAFGQTLRRAADAGMTVIIAVHHREVLGAVDHVLYLQNGKPVFAGTRDEFLQAEAKQREQHAQVEAAASTVAAE